MSAAMDSDTDPQTVYVELLDEGTACLRPTLAQSLGEGRYRLMPTPEYDPADEHWQFPPGSIVRCRKEVWSGGEVLVARETAGLA
jgi:hypothetical protein